MRKSGSYLASEIDREYQKKKRATMEKEFFKKFCANCANKTKMVCNITQKIDGEYTCVEYKRGENK